MTVPVSAGVLTDTTGYFDALTAFRAGDANGRELVADLTNAREQWQQKVHARRDAIVWKVADLLLKQPVVDSALVQSV